MPGLTCFPASPSPEALGQICHPYLEVCPVLLYPELLERDQCSELSEALCKATGKVTAVTCSTCKSSHSLGNKTAMNAYQGFEDAKLCRSAKFRKIPLEVHNWEQEATTADCHRKEAAKHRETRRCSSRTTLIPLAVRT